ncbi:MAG: electron transfer flavoprotein subunit alpha/FixB family protein [Saprospiraceae bacterium]|nr:electron transfer flavoprotein subunit alpha/FixB family protein [Saprospiraceae bacterium]
MSVLVYIESPKGRIKKSGFEVAYYGSQLAKSLGTECIALLIGIANDAASVGQYGPSRIIHVNPDKDESFDSQNFTSIITKIALDHQSNIIILSNTATGKAITGRIGIKMNAGTVSGANSLPEVADGFVINKSVYSGKAIARYVIETENKVISVMGNTLQPQIIGSNISPETVQISNAPTRLKVIERKISEGIIPLPEAELVVSAGRGMKGPENWGIIEELASSLGATTACSRPVADSHWRPHHEHVGQTGVAIRPNLYIAVGISGAIQHLAGVNNSKVIVVINKDAEAPFFKAADYGVVGDLFEIVPKLTAAINKYKQQ